MPGSRTAHETGMEARRRMQVSGVTPGRHLEEHRQSTRGTAARVRQVGGVEWAIGSQ